MSRNAKPPAEARARRGSGDGGVLDVRVIPRAPRTRVDGTRGGAILVRLAAPPVDGAANDALIEFLAAALGLPRRNLQIVAGETSRDKRIAIEGLEPAAAVAKLLAL